MNTNEENKIVEFPAADPTEGFTGQTDAPTECAPATELTPTTDLPAIKLGDAYDSCLLGATIKGRYAYSIKHLITFYMRDMGMNEEQADAKLREDIVEIARAHGADAPEFIDDTLMEARVEIIMPDGRR